MNENELTAQIILEYERVISDFMTIVQEAQKAAAAITDTFNAASEQIRAALNKSTATVRNMNTQITRTGTAWGQVTVAVQSFSQLLQVITIEIIKLANPIQLIIDGFKGLLGVLSDIIVTIGRIRVTINTVLKGIGRVLKAPFDLVSRSLEFLRSMLEKVFRAFEWVQYQLFMQFMNVWLALKIFGPLLESFTEYNREIYNAWSLINDTLEETSYRLTVMGVELTHITDIMYQAGLSLAVEFGEVPINVAKAFYDALSAGIAVSDMFHVVAESMKAARAGVTSVDVALRGGIQAMYAFGLTAQDLTDVFDAQFEAVKIGIIRYDELVSAMGRVYQSAASLGGKLERLKETYYAIAFLTRVGLSPEMGAFGLARLYEELANPDTIKALEQLGVRVYDLRGDFRGLLPVIADLTNTLSGFSTKAQETMLASVGFEMRAIRVLRAMVNNYATFADIAEQYNKEVAGAMESAYQKQIKAISFAVDRLKVAWESFKISVVTASSDALVAFANAGRQLLNYGSMLLKNYEDILSNFVKFAASFYGAFAVLALVAGVVRVLLTPFGLLSTAFGILIYQAQQGTQFFEDFKNRFPLLGAVVERVAQSLKDFVDIFVHSKFERIPVWFKTLTSGLVGLFAQVPSIQRFKRAIEEFAETFQNFVRGFGDTTVTELGRQFGKILQAIGLMLKDAIVSLFGLEDVEGTVADFARVFIKNVYDAIMAVFAGMFGRERITLPELFLELGVILGLYIKTPEGKYAFNAEGVSQFLITVLKIAFENVLRIFAGWQFVLLLAELRFAFNAIKFLLGGQLLTTITQAMGRGGANTVMASLLQRLGFGLRAGTAVFLILDLFTRVVDSDLTRWLREHSTITLFVELALATSAVMFGKRLSQLIGTGLGQLVTSLLSSQLIKIWPMAILSGASIAAIVSLAVILAKNVRSSMREALNDVYNEFLQKARNIEQLRSEAKTVYTAEEAAVLVGMNYLEQERKDVQEAVNTYTEYKKTLGENVDTINKSLKDVSWGFKRAGITAPPTVTPRAQAVKMKQAIETTVEQLKEQGKTIEDNNKFIEESVKYMVAIDQQMQEATRNVPEVWNSLTSYIGNSLVPLMSEVQKNVNNVAQALGEGGKQLVEQDKVLVQQLTDAIKEIQDEINAGATFAEVGNRLEMLRQQIQTFSNTFENKYKDIRKVNSEVDAMLGDLQHDLQVLDNVVVKLLVGVSGNIELFLRELARHMNIAIDEQALSGVKNQQDALMNILIQRGKEMVEKAFGEKLWRELFNGFFLQVQDMLRVTTDTIGRTIIGSFIYEPDEAAAKKAIADIVTFVKAKFADKFARHTRPLFDEAFQQTIIEPLASFMDDVNAQFEELQKSVGDSPELRDKIASIQATADRLKGAIETGAWDEIQTNIPKFLDLAFQTLSETNKERVQTFGAIVKEIDQLYTQYGDEFVNTMRRMFGIAKEADTDTVKMMLYIAAFLAPDAVKEALDLFVSGQKDILAAIQDIRSEVQEQESQMFDDVLRELQNITVEIEEVPTPTQTEWIAIAQFAQQVLTSEALKTLKTLLGITTDSLEDLATALQQGFSLGLTIVRELVLGYYSVESAKRAKEVFSELLTQATKGTNILSKLTVSAGLTPTDQLKNAFESFYSQYRELYEQGNETVIQAVDSAKRLYESIQTLIDEGNLSAGEIMHLVSLYSLFINQLTTTLKGETSTSDAREMLQEYKDMWQNWQSRVQRIFDNQIDFAQMFVERILETNFDIEAFVDQLGVDQNTLLEILKAQGYVADTDKTALDALRRNVKEGNKDIIDFIYGQMIYPVMSDLLRQITIILTEGSSDILLELAAGMTREQFAEELERARRYVSELRKKNEAAADRFEQIFDIIGAKSQASGADFIAGVYMLTLTFQVMEQQYGIEIKSLQDLADELNNARSDLERQADRISKGLDTITDTANLVQTLIQAYGARFTAWIEELKRKYNITTENMYEAVQELVEQGAINAQDLLDLATPVWQLEFQEKLHGLYNKLGLRAPTELARKQREIESQFSEIEQMFETMAENDRQVFATELSGLQMFYEYVLSIPDADKRLVWLQWLDEHLSTDVLPRARDVSNAIDDVLQQQRERENIIQQKLRELEQFSLDFDELFNVPLQITNQVVQEIKDLFAEDEWQTVFGEQLAYQYIDVESLHNLVKIDDNARKVLKAVLQKQATAMVGTLIASLLDTLSDEGRRILAEALGVLTPETLQAKLQGYIQEFAALAPIGTETYAKYSEVLLPLFTQLADALADGNVFLANAIANVIEQVMQIVRRNTSDTSDTVSDAVRSLQDEFNTLSTAIQMSFDTLQTAFSRGYKFLVERFSLSVKGFVLQFNKTNAQVVSSLITTFEDAVELAVAEATYQSPQVRVQPQSVERIAELARSRIGALIDVLSAYVDSERALIEQLSTEQSQLIAALETASDADKEVIQSRLSEIETLRAQHVQRFAELSYVLNELRLFASGEIKDFKDLSEHTQAVLINFGIQIGEVTKELDFSDVYQRLKDQVQSGLTEAGNAFIDAIRDAFADVRDAWQTNEQMTGIFVTYSKDEYDLIVTNIMKELDSVIVSSTDKLVAEYTSDLDELKDKSVPVSTFRTSMANMLEEWQTALPGVLSERTLIEIETIMHQIRDMETIDAAMMNKIIERIRALLTEDIRAWFIRNKELIQHALETKDLSSLPSDTLQVLSIIFDLFSGKIERWVDAYKQTLESAKFPYITDARVLVNVLNQTLNNIDMQFVKLFQTYIKNGGEVKDIFTKAIDDVYSVIEAEAAELRTKYEGDALREQLKKLNEKYGVMVYDPVKDIVISREQFQKVLGEGLDDLIELLKTTDNVTAEHIRALGPSVVILLELLQVIFGDILDAMDDAIDAVSIIDPNEIVVSLQRLASNLYNMSADIQEVFDNINNADFYEFTLTYIGTLVNSLADTVMMEIQKAQQAYGVDTTEFKNQLQQLSKTYGIDLLSLYNKPENQQDLQNLRNDIADEFATYMFELWNTFKDWNGSWEEFVTEHGDYAQLLIDIYNIWKNELDEEEQKLRQQKQAFINTFNGFMNSLTNLLTTLGDTFPALSDSMNKAVQALNIISNTASQASQLYNNMVTAQGAGGSMATFATGLGWTGIIMTVVTGVLQFINLFTQSTDNEIDAIREHMNAVERNTVALEALTNIISRMQATLYNAPSEFGYAFVPATASATPVSSPSMTSTVMVNINVNGANITDSDVNKITHAVEAAIRRVY